MKRICQMFVFAFAMLTATIYVKAQTVVEVNDWDKLKNCLVAQNAQTCKLTQNIETGSGSSFDAFLKNVDEKTLDIQGYTLKLPIAIYTNSKLNITGTSAGKIIAPDSGANIALMAMQGGIINIDNITVEASKKTEGQVIAVAGINNHLTIGKNATIIGKYGINIQNYNDNIENGANNSIVDIYGTIEGFEERGLPITIKGDITGTNHTISSNAPTINIYDGAKLIGHDAPAIYGAGYGFWNIKGGYLEGAEALSIKSGVYNISGGTLKANGQFIETPQPQSNGEERTGAAISVTTNKSYDGHVKINVTGSNTKIESENGYAIFEGVTNALDNSQSALEELTIIDGIFVGKANSETAIKLNSKDSLTDKINITGGKYSSDIKEYLNTKDNENYSQKLNGSVVKLITIKFDNKEYKIGEGERWASVNGNNDYTQGLVDLQKALAIYSRKANFSRFVNSNGETVSRDTQFFEDTTIDVKYFITITYKGQQYKVEVGEAWKDYKSSKSSQALKDLQKALANKDENGRKFVKFINVKTGKKIDKNTKLTEDMELVAIYQVTINFDGDDFTIEYQEGTSVKIGDAKNASGQTLSDKMKSLKKNVPNNKNSVYFVDEVNNRVYNTTLTDRNMNIKSQYTVKVEIEGKTVTPKEGTLIKDVKVLSDIAEDDHFYYFIDKDGNHYNLNDKLNSNVKLTAVYKVTIKVNPVDDVSIGVGYTTKYGTTLRDILESSWGSGLKAYIEAEGFLEFIDENGNVVNLDDEITQDVILTAVYKTENNTNDNTNNNNNDDNMKDNTTNLEYTILENPNTLDNVITYIVLAIISLGMIIGIIITKKTKLFKR